MIILNTTFHVHSSVEDKFLRWVRVNYIPQALSSGVLHSPSLARILIDVEPESVSFALQFSAENIDDASRWHDRDGEILRRRLSGVFGDRIVYFTTYMENLTL